MITPYTIFLSALTGVSLFQFLHHLYLSIQLREDKKHLPYAVLSFGVSLYIFCNIQLYDCYSVERYKDIVQVQMYGTALFHIGLLWFCVIFTDLNRRILFPICASFIVFIIARHIEPELIYSHILGISIYILPWGEQLSVLQSKSSIWNYLYQMLILSVYILVYRGAWKLHQHGDNRRALFLSACITVVLAGVINDILVFNLGLNWIFLGETGFVALIIMMGLLLSSDIIKSANLSKQIEENERKFRAVFESSYQFMGMLDAEGRLMDANFSACSLINTDLETILGSYFWETPWWQGQPEEQQRLKESIVMAARGEFVHYQTRHTAADGKIHLIDFSLNPVRDKDGRIIFIVPEGRDITNIIKADEKIRNQNDELTAANEELTAAIEELEATNEEFEAQNNELIDSQKLLFDSELKFKTLFESAGDAIFIMDEFCFLDCNTKTLEIFGCERNDIIGQSPHEFSPEIQPDGRPSGRTAREKIDLAMAGDSQSFEWRHLKLDRTPFDAEVSLNRFELGGAFFLQAIVRDISKRKRDEESLRESEEYNKILFTDSHIPIVVIDRETGLYTDCNDAAVNIYRYASREEVIGKTPFDVSAPFQYDGTDSRTAARVRIRDAARQGIQTFEWLHQRPNGEQWDGLVNLMRFTFRGKSLLQFTIHDITDRKRAEKALEDTLKKLKRSQEISHVGSWEFDTATKLFISSEEGLRLFGFPPGYTPSLEEVSRLIYTEDRAIVDHKFSGALKEGKPYRVEFRIYKKDTGETRYLVSLTETAPDGNGGAFRIFGINQDITEQKISQEEKEKIQAQLIHAQKMEAIGTLASGLAHDFNNMLAGIMGSMSILKIILNKETLSQPETVNEYIKTAQDASTRAADMIKQLLTISRRHEIQMAPVDAVLSLKHVLTICRNSFPKSINLDFRLPGTPLQTLADPTQLEQVFLNLCVNASHAMTIMRSDREKEGGTLTVTIDELKSDKYFYRLNPEAKPDIRYLKIMIRDTGVGMDSSVLRRIFEPFFTTKKKELGSGLGLSMVYSIVQQHNGFINVYSEKDAGTAFTVYLPYLTDETGKTAASMPERELQKGQGTILIIDDEKAIIRVAEGILKACGYTVVSREIGIMGVEYFQENHENINAVLLDMSMPGLSGLDIFEKLLAIDGSVRVLLSSGFAEDERVKSARQKGVRGFIQKPYTAEELAEAVKKVLD